MKSFWGFWHPFRGVVRIAAPLAVTAGRVVFAGNSGRPIGDTTARRVSAVNMSVL